MNSKTNNQPSEDANYPDTDSSLHNIPSASNDNFDWAPYPYELPLKDGDVLEFGPFRVDADGCFEVGTDGGGEDHGVRICDPLVVGPTMSMTDRANCSILVSFIGIYGAVVEVTLNYADLYTSKKKALRALLVRGFEVEPADKIEKTICSLIIALRDTSNHGVLATQSGWVEGTSHQAFAHRNHVISSGPVVRMISNPKTRARPSGDLNAYKELVDSLVKGNPFFEAIVCLSVSAPVANILGKVPPSMHLQGDSSSGKSTSGKLAISSWVSPDDPEALISWGSSVNGFEASCVACNDMAICLDDIRNSKRQLLQQAAYQLDGTANARMTATLKLATSRRRSVSCISTGEISYEDALAKVGQSSLAGEHVRLPTISIDDGNGIIDDLKGHETPKKFIDELLSAAHRCYGVLGTELITALVKETDDRASLLKVWHDAFMLRVGPTCLDDVMERVADRFGVAAASGEYMINKEIVSWQADAAIEAVVMLFQRWASNYQPPAFSQDTQILEAVASYIQVRIDQLKDFHDDTQSGRDRSTSFVGYRMSDEQGVHLVLVPNAYAAMCKSAGYTKQTVTRALKGKNILRPSANGDATQKLKPDGYSRFERFYVLTEEAYAVSNEADEPSEAEDTQPVEAEPSTLKSNDDCHVNDVMADEVYDLEVDLDVFND